MCHTYTVIRPRKVMFKRRFNFRKAKWTEFFQELVEVIINIPPTKQNYDQFIEAVKVTSRKNIPRRHRENYIPGMSQDLHKDYEQYAKTYEEDTFANDTTEMREQLLENIGVSKRNK